MYNLRLLPYTYEFEFLFSEELIIPTTVLIIILTLVTYIIFRKYKILSKVGVFLNRKDRLVNTNYTLGFENIEVSSKLPAKKISAITKMVLFIFALTFILTPFSDFLPTLEYSNYYWGGAMNFLLY